jgi:hypothetical protein
MGTVFVLLASMKDIKIDAEEMKEQGQVTIWHGLFFLIFGSLTLIFIYYFKNLANFLLTCIIAIQCLAALYLTFKTYTESIETNVASSGLFNLLRKKVFQNITIVDMVIIIIGVNFVLAYLITKHWILNNFLGYCLCFTALSILHINNFKTCCIILTLVFFYDVFWVYFSPAVFHGNVMETAALTLDLPIKLEMPVLFGTNPLKDCVYLGLGDLIIPGLLVKFCRNLDKTKNIKVYFFSATVFYFSGLVLCGAMLVVFNYPQPALFYLCPALIIGTTCVARSRNEFQEIWKGEHNLEHININPSRQIDDIFNDGFQDAEETDLEMSQQKSL